MLEIVGFVLIGFVVLGFVLTSFVFSNKNRTLYCWVYDKKEFKTVHGLLKLSDDEFELDFDNFQYTGRCKFIISSHPDWVVWCDVDKRKAFVSHRDTHECIVSGFYDRGSQLLYRKVANILPRELGKFYDKYKWEFLLFDTKEYKGLIRFAKRQLTRSRSDNL